MGWGWGASPDPKAGHGVLGVHWGRGGAAQGVYIQGERACRGVYSGGVIKECVEVEEWNVDPCLGLPLVKEGGGMRRKKVENVVLPFHVTVNMVGRVMVTLKDLVIFNRVPKTGSLSLLRYLLFVETLLLHHALLACCSS